jgi:DNA invertase Pin-like site-specific DNA recombinase
MTFRYSTKLVPAAGYLRRSSAKQERSIPAQKADILAYATEHGYRIVAWFTDDGVSGDATDKRVGFQALHRAACNGAPWRVIICWDQDRFGRFNSIEAGYWVHPLMQAGVKLVTVTEGPIDWSDFTGRVIYSLKQEGKHQFLIDLAKRVSRGQKDNAQAGGWNGGPIPYALDRGEFTTDGRLVRRLQDGERKRAGYLVKLVPVEDELRLEAVRFAYTRFATADVSVRQLARELQERGYPSPSGAGWRHATVGKMLANPIYYGTLRWADKSPGKYSPVGKPVTLGGAFEPIVSAKLWARVQKRLARAKNNPHARRAEYPLRGLLFCEHCGSPMTGIHIVRNQGRHVYHRYICSTYDRLRDQSPCFHHTVPADRVLLWLTRALRELLLGPARADLIGALERHLEATTRTASKAPRTHEKRLAELDRRIARLRRAVARIDDDGLVEELRQAKSERERVETEASQAGRVVDPRAEAVRLADQVWQLGEKLGSADPAVLREVFGQLVGRITCRWDTTTTPSGRTRSTLVEGRVELRDNPFVQALSGGVAYAGAWEPDPQPRRFFASLRMTGRASGLVRASYAEAARSSRQASLRSWITSETLPITRISHTKQTIAETRMNNCISPRRNPVTSPLANNTLTNTAIAATVPKKARYVPT